MSMGHAEAESIIATAWMHGFECDLQKEKSAEMFKTSGDKGKKINKKNIKYNKNSNIANEKF